MAKDEIEEFPTSKNLLATYPWLREMLDLPEGSFWIVSSENRDGNDLDQLCASLGRIFPSRLTSHRGFYVVAARKIFNSEGVVTRRLGPMTMALKSATEVPADWQAEHFFTCAGDTVAVGVAKCSGHLSTDHLKLALKFPSVFLGGSLDQSNAPQWLEFASREAVSNNRPFGEVRLNLGSCIKLFPSDRAAGAVVFGSEDFGGYFSLGCEPGAPLNRVAAAS